MKIRPNQLSKRVKEFINSSDKFLWRLLLAIMSVVCFSFLTQKNIVLASQTQILSKLLNAKPSVESAEAFINKAHEFPLTSNLRINSFRKLQAVRSSLALAFPLQGDAVITSNFGLRTHPISGKQRFHAGTDLGAPEGAAVLAALPGVVDTAGWINGYGKTVILEHESGTIATLYAHLSEILVRPGQSISQGTIIGKVGQTGNVTGPHLHFELQEKKGSGWDAIDARNFLLAKRRVPIQINPNLARAEEAMPSCDIAFLGRCKAPVSPSIKFPSAMPLTAPCNVGFMGNCTSDQ